MIGALIGAGIALGLTVVAGCLALCLLTITVTITRRPRASTTSGSAPACRIAHEMLHVR